MRSTAYRGRGCHALCVRTHLHFSCFHFSSLFMFLEAFLFYSVLYYLQKFNVPLFKKDVFVTNGYFSLTRSISVVMK